MLSLALGISLFLLQTAVHGAGIVPPSARHYPGLPRSRRAQPPRHPDVMPGWLRALCAVPSRRGALTLPFSHSFQRRTHSPDVIQSCPVTQCCSDAFESGYFECYKCVGTAMNVTDFTLAQEYVDVVITSCKTEGFTLPVLTLPGQDPNRALASALPAGASSVPVFASVVRPSVTTPPRTSSAPIMTTSLLLSPSPSPPLSQQSSSSSQSSTATSPTSTAAAAPTGSAPPSAAVRLHPYTPGMAAPLMLLMLLLV
ncbi:hypothetical protein DFH06DRAFT_1322122 [Mycena polygramma]|nr:hypothetical protein DFH06DRAFT_1322122 [Mycena polygramma]